MKIPAMVTGEVKLIGAAVLIGALALYWITRKGVASQVGYSVGSATVNAATGIIGGVNDALGIPRTSDVIAAANDPAKNPLHNVGDWVGQTIYNATH